MGNIKIREIMSKDSELIYFELLKNRNFLQLKALRRGHTFEEEISFGTHNLEMKVVIGGEELGITMWINAGRGENTYGSIRDALSELMSEYDDCYTNIPKNK